MTVIQRKKEEIYPSKHLEPKKILSKKELMNSLNKCNFTNTPVNISIRDETGDMVFATNATPSPLFGKYPVFIFSEKPSSSVLKSGKVNLVIPDEETEIHAITQLRKVTTKGICVELPEESMAVDRQPRFADTGENISVHFFLNGTSCRGNLVTLLPDKVKIILSPISFQILNLYKTPPSIELIFTKGKKKVLSFNALPIEPTSSDSRNTITFRPLSQQIEIDSNLAKSYNYCSLKPKPDLKFKHPLFYSDEIWVIDSLSSIGVKIKKRENERHLILGMEIENAAIVLGDLYSLPVSLKVAHFETKFNAKGQEETLYTFFYKELSPQTHKQIMGLVHKADNPQIRLNPPVVDSDLWRFLFETGFIYKKKYKLISKNRNEIRDTYKTLYSGLSSVTRYITYYRNGRTIGHMSLLRMAQDAWLCHHHAALKGDEIKVGLSILKHIVYDITGSQWNPEMNMGYILCYFRPENSFPNFFFNGFVKQLKNPKACSSDLFTYLTIRKSKTLPLITNEAWKLSEAKNSDIIALEESYETYSGGLFIEAFDLFERKAHPSVLSSAYKTEGLKKNRQTWAIRIKQKTIAVIIVHTSDIALNLSDLTNCMTVCIIDYDCFTKEILKSALATLSKHFTTQNIPILITPSSWAESQNLPSEKTYYLWAFNTKFSKDYVKYFFDVSNM